ncbi:3-hydroxyacyl-CoA dehydrogenase family protein [Salinibaculum rarum]|uniref:3-hydroxyacyl-CoA dehydrogenase family protein n=1 Tax=Salinibaculum rarum TaxID=3058903 RepID=UPI00265D685B|nr:3-hydroxyacyl-CoA dehydrogenase family protein [Salinibaculum sp. KK48]
MDVAVLGAEQLGRAIAQVCAIAGHDVRFYGDEANDVMDAIDAIERRLPADVDTGDRLSGTTGREGAISGADIVVETTTTDATALQAEFADIESDIDRETLVVPAASGVSVTAAAAGLRHPDRAVGLRFCDPPDAALVEVVVAEQTSQESCDRARSFVEGLERVPVVVRDAPGVVSTRVALALEAEAMRLVDDEVAGVEAVDEVLERGFDHASGPLVQADRAGLDNRLETLETLHAELGDRFAPPEILRDLVAAGNTGGPSGAGFYVWENGEPTEPALPAPEIPRGDRTPDDPANE